jgi:predicted metal-dependent phosphoesterase TrpH
MKADLHMHSTSSDGSLSSFEVIKRAKNNGCDIMALTDHDICALVEENMNVAKNLGITFIPGIELSTTYENRPVHVLGYFRDKSYKSEEMVSYYKEIKGAREMRAKKFIKNLKEFFNIEITYEEVFSYSKRVVTRPHIAKAIVNNYPEYDFDYIFDNFIGDHSKAYVPTCELSVKEGIDLLKRNNCVVVLAHPTLLAPHIKDFVLSHDFDGLEGVYFRNKPGEEEVFRKLIKDRDLLITGGSDFHRIVEDNTHGDIGEIFIEGNDLTKFLNKYNI